MWEWELGTDLDVAFRTVGHRLGKTLEEVDEQPWDKVGRLIDLMRWERKVGG